MRRFQRRLRSQYRRLGSVLTVLVLMSEPVVFATEIQVGRYATVSALPTQEQVQLLSAIVNVVFPASVTTVGQAMHYLLGCISHRFGCSAVFESDFCGNGVLGIR